LTAVAHARVLNAGAGGVPVDAPSPRHVTVRVLRTPGADAAAEGAMSRRTVRRGFGLRDAPGCLTASFRPRLLREGDALLELTTQARECRLGAASVVDGRRQTVVGGVQTASAIPGLRESLRPE